MAHANGADTVRSAAIAGADSIEHGNYIDKDAIDAMKAYGTVWVPTIATTGNLFGCERYPREELEKIFRSATENLKYAWEQKVYLALGSDAGAYRVPHGQGVVDENNIFTRILGRSQQLDEHLAKGEAIIRQKFQEGKR